MLKGGQISRSSLVLISLILAKFFVFLDTLLSFRNALSLLLYTFLFHCRTPSVETFPRYLHSCTYFGIDDMQFAHWAHHLGNNHAFCFLLVSIFNHFFSFSFTNLCWSFAFLFISPITTVSSAYMLLRLWPPVINPDSYSNIFRIGSIYKLNMSCE